jgi:putative phage-type endonuclease
MKSSIRLVPVTGMTQQEWLLYRKNGIGASEVGTIFGLSPYKAVIQLFYEKIGEDLGLNVENISQFLGKEQEPFIATLWEYWETDQETMIKNYREGRQIRRCKRVNAYAHNDKYPWLFVSLDREINQYGGRGNGALELKTIGGYEADKWEVGIPPFWVFQLQTQLLVCEYDYGELAVMKDNRDFFVYPFEASKTIAESIIETTRKFWDKVTEARKIITQRFEAEQSFNSRAVDELNAQLVTLEPEPDGSDAFNEFLKEKYKIALPGEMLGNPGQLDSAQKHKAVQAKMKDLETEKSLYEQQLKTDFGHKGCDRFDFGANGYVSWKADSNGVRRFLNKTK